MMVAIRIGEWRTVQRKVFGTRHAHRVGSERVLCSGPRVSEMKESLTRSPTSLERLLCHVDCITCMRQLVRLMPHD